MVMDLQDRENTSLPLYEQQLREAETCIQNLLNAIQQGILTKSTKTRLEELEATKEDLEIKIANEKITKPRISPEFVTFWLHKFRKLDVRQQSHRKMLIDAFVNGIAGSYQRQKRFGFGLPWCTTASVLIGFDVLWGHSLFCYPLCAGS